jgi:hypothetical protein
MGTDTCFLVYCFTRFESVRVVHVLNRLVPEKTRKTTIEKKTHIFFFRSQDVTSDAHSPG